MIRKTVMVVLALAAVVTPVMWVASLTVKCKEAARYGIGKG